MVRLLAKCNGTALCSLDLDQCTGGRAGIMPLRRVWEQLQAISVRGNNLANASDQVAVRSESTTGEKRFQLRHERIELAYQIRNLLNWMWRIRHHFH